MNHYCIGLTKELEVVAAYRCNDTEPVQIKELRTGSFNVIVPANSLEEAKTGAVEALTNYMED